MLLPPLLRAHGYMRTEAPPGVWEADTEDVAFVPLLGEIIAAALRPGTPLADLTLAASNVVVTEEPAGAEASPTSPSPGEYVAITVSGAGAWSPDWTWVPDGGSHLPGIPFPVARLGAADARFAYGRQLPAGSSVTIFLARLLPRR
jgi:hypothetical protein